jgi:hypothetical protein|tara:strand:+ start:348 stop:530 length:183 start_codon:yes stop_codon:yes gene_type:complete
MLDFSTALLLCGTATYIANDNVYSFVTLATLGILSRVVSFAINLNQEKENDEKKQKLLQE